MKRSNTQTRSPKVFPDITAELLEGGHSIRFRAPGRSMLPTIKEGEAITVEPVELSAVRTGDIILYRNGNSVIAHRVVQIRQETSAGKSSLKARRAGPRAKRSLRPEGPIVVTHPSSLSPHHSFLLRGDASFNCDYPVKPEQILGKVVSVERDGKSIDLCSFRAKVLLIAHLGIVKFKRWIKQALFRRESSLA